MVSIDIRKYLKSKRSGPTIFISLFAVVGTIALLAAHAATAGSEISVALPTQGIISGNASIVHNSTAIDHQAVQFGQTVTTSGGDSSSGGSGATNVSCSTGGSKLASLTDSFPGTKLNTRNWYVEPIAGQGNTLSGHVTVSNGILTLSQNTGYTSVNSQNSYDATGSCGYMKIIPDPNSTADQADDGWGLWNSTQAPDGSPGFSNGYEIGVQSGKLYVMVVVNDTVAPFSFSAPYNPSTMAYARIRESGGRLYFGYSANGINWTEPTGWSIKWNPSIVNIAHCSVQIYAGNLGSRNVGSTGFADFNVPQ